MRRITVFTLGVLVAVMLSPLLSHGQATQGPTVDQNQSAVDQNAMLGKVTQYMGSPLVDRDGLVLGKIHDVLIDLKTLRPLYLIISTGGIWGIGNRLTSVPITAVRLADDNTLVADIDKERFQSAPAFPKDDWPPGTKISWSKEIHSFYGVQPWK
jgi:sporulation protein YlmC with PRC-barrel domain